MGDNEKKEIHLDVYLDRQELHIAKWKDVGLQKTQLAEVLIMLRQWLIRSIKMRLQR